MVIQRKEKGYCPTKACNKCSSKKWKGNTDMAVKREILCVWKNNDIENKQFRMVVEIDEQRDTFDIYIEQFVYVTDTNKDMWLRVEPQHYVDNSFHIPIFIMLSIFENLTAYIKRNFYSIGGCCD